VKLSGEGGTSPGVRHLCHPGSFQRGSHDMFIIASDRSLGGLSRLVVWHDNTGTSPGWYLSRIIVRDLQTSSCYQFVADTWLTLSTLEDLGHIEKELSSLGTETQTFFSFSALRGIAKNDPYVYIWQIIYYYYY